MNKGPEKQKKEEKPNVTTHSTKATTPNTETTECIEPSLSLSMEETILIKDGLDALPIDRKKTVVFDRLLMKVGMAESYWQKIEKARHIRREQLANQLRTK